MLERGPGKHPAATAAKSTLVPKKVTTTTAKPEPPPPAVAAAIVPWHQLPVPIAETLVLPGPAGQLVVIGGKVSSGQSATGAFLINPASGSLHLVANLAQGVHAAAGAVLGLQDFVFGGSAGAGTSPAATSVVQSFSTAATPAGHPSGATKAAAAAVTTGTMPAARAEGEAVTIGTTAYVVGGYDGAKGAAKAEGAVLATSDGSTFSTVAHLRVPVRDPAVAALHGQIYVFGGAKPSTAAPGVGGWVPIADIQQVDPVTGKATVVGRLPVALEGAAALNLAGHLYVAGGRGPLGTNRVIWGFEASSGRVVHSGQLAVGVSGAGAAAVAGKAWLVGGTAAGHPVATVQVLQLR